MRRRAPSYASAKHMFYCFEAAYAFSFLHDGYGFPLDRALIRFTNAVGGIDPSWTIDIMRQFAEHGRQEQ